MQELKWIHVNKNGPNKPLPEPMLTYCQVDPWKQIRVQIRMQQFPFMKLHVSHLKMLSAECQPFHLSPNMFAFQVLSYWKKLIGGADELTQKYANEHSSVWIGKKYLPHQ